MSPNLHTRVTAEEVADALMNGYGVSNTIVIDPMFSPIGEMITTCSLSENGEWLCADDIAQAIYSFDPRFIWIVEDLLYFTSGTRIIFQ